MSQEHERSTTRYKTRKPGKIMLPDGQFPIDCTARNMSATGALLEVDDGTAVPDQFTLMMGEDLSFECTIAWRRQTEVGVTFG